MNLLELLLWPVTVAIAVVFNLLTSYSAAPVIDDVTPSPAVQRAARQQRYRGIMERTDPGSFERMMARNAELKRAAAYKRGPSLPEGGRVRQIYRPAGVAPPNLDFFGRAEPTPLR